MIITFFPPVTTGAGELLVHTDGELRFVVDCNVNPMALVDHIKMTSGPEGMMVSCAGEDNGLVGSLAASHSW